MTQSITIMQPDDWHVHLREGEALPHTIKATASTFARALFMPNLIEPLDSIAKVNQYRQQVLKHASNDFTPLFTLYMTDKLSGEELQQVKRHPHIVGCKLYPAGATTNSAAGVQAIETLYPLFETMQDENLVLQIHGETTTDDIFEREAKFVEKTLKPLTQNFPKLRIVFEHISSQAACEFVEQSNDNVAATITIHHLLYNRNDLLAGGIKPHFYCLPILKKQSDQSALQQAALSANPKFFLGTDSAPHAIQKKESSCGCAGIYSAPYAMPLYAEFFESNSKLALLEPFASHFGADFYQQPRNTSTITMIKKSQNVPYELKLDQQKVKPIAAGQTIQWTVI